MVVRRRTNPNANFVRQLFDGGGGKLFEGNLLLLRVVAMGCCCCCELRGKEHLYCWVCVSGFERKSEGIVLLWVVVVFVFVVWC